MDVALRILFALIGFAIIGWALSEEQVTARAKVVIVGGGMAGVSAARRLEEAGQHDYLLLEGSDRVGGRVREAPLGDYKVEVGSLWIHGGGSNPVYKFAKQYNVATYLTDYEEYTVRDSTGTNVTDEFEVAYETLGPAWEAFTNYAKIMQDRDLPDMSIKSMLQRFGWDSKTAVQMIAEQYEVDYEVAVSASETSAKWFFDSSADDFTDDVYVVTGTYGDVIRGMTDELFPENASPKRLMLNTTVKRIEQQSGEVRVHTSDGKLYVGERVILTVSLGVLQNRLIEFAPQLPEWKTNSIFAFNFVTDMNIYMQFPSVFWDDTEYILHASKRRGYFPFWQNFNKLWPGSRILHGNVLHTEANRLLQLTDSDIKQEAMESLRGIYGAGIPDATGIVVPRWTTDPLFMGMYCDWPPGFSNSSHQALVASVDRVHFAGAHTSQKYFAYLHGAYFSGIRAANEVMECLSGECHKYRPPYENRGCTYKLAENYNVSALVDNGSCKFPPTSGRAANSALVSIWLMLAIVCGLCFT